MFIATSYNKHKKLAHDQSKSSDTAIQIIDEEGNIKYTYNKITTPAYVYQNKDVLYVLTETIDDYGKLYIFDLKLRFKGSIYLTGKSSCHINTFFDNYIITHYWDGYVQVLNKYLNTENTFFQWDKDSKHIQIKNKLEHSQNRQIGSHPHFSLSFNEKLLITNLGNDSIYIYDKELMEIGKIELPDGCGPRNLVRYNNFIYTANELNNSISIIEYIQDKFILKDTIKLGSDKGRPSEIKRYKNNLFISIRKENLIIWFKINYDGKLIEMCKKNVGNCPRSFDLSSDGREIVVGHQKDDNCTIYDLEYINHNIIFKKEIEVECPNYVKYIKID